MFVKLLKQSGAIPFVKSTTPIKASSDTENFIWGQARNPWNLSRSCGGRCGGQAGLVSSNCSILGVGIQEPSSVRACACYCGIASLVPSTGRLPLGKFGPILGSQAGSPQSVISTTTGILSKRVQNIEILFSSTTATMNSLLPSPRFLPVPFRPDILHNPRRLKIGYFGDTDLIKICSSAQRGLQLAKQALWDKGYELIEFDPGCLKQAFSSLMTILYCDQLKTVVKQVLAKEPSSNRSVANVIAYANRSPYYFTIIKWLLNRDRMNLCAFPEVKGTDYVSALITRSHFLDEFLDKLQGNGEQAPFDALLCPAAPLPAPPIPLHLQCTVISNFYLSLFNFLGLPSGTVPVTVIQEGEDRWDPMRDADEPYDSVSRMQREILQGSVGLPISVQVVAPSFRDEVILRVMKDIEEGVDFLETPTPY